MQPPPSSIPQSAAAAPSRTIRGLPVGIWALGFVSLLMDTSSELIHSLLPVFLTVGLGASAMTLGLLEGIAEATAAITKVFSGVISDFLGKRKLLAVLGYGLAALTKPVFPLANSVGWVFAARFTDRVGKGIRGAPRDALVAEIAPPAMRGAAYGLRQSLDSVGAFVGPLLATALMACLANDIRAVLWVAVVPAFLAVGLLVFGVHEPEQAAGPAAVRVPVRLAEAKRLPPAFWWTVGLGTVFSMARFSEAFLLLRAKDLGLTMSMIPLVLVAMNIVYAATAYPAGIATDRLGHRGTLVLGLVILIAADLVLAAAASWWAAMVGAGLWGLHLGLTQGTLSKLVADVAPADLRGTAFGVFNLLGGLALLGASTLAGALWSSHGAAATFLTGSAFALVAAVGLLRWKQPSPVPGDRSGNAA